MYDVMHWDVQNYWYDKCLTLAADLRDGEEDCGPAQMHECLYC